MLQTWLWLLQGVWLAVVHHTLPFAKNKCGLLKSILFKRVTLNSTKISIMLVVWLYSCLLVRLSYATVASPTILGNSITVRDYKSCWFFLGFPKKVRLDTYKHSWLGRCLSCGQSPLLHLSHGRNPVCYWPSLPFLRHLRVVVTQWLIIFTL